MSDRFDAIEEQQKREKAIGSFKASDWRTLRRQSDSELALLESQFSPFDPQCILVKDERQRRLNERKIEADRFNTCVTCGSRFVLALSITFLSWVLKSYNFKEPTNAPAASTQVQKSPNSIAIDSVNEKARPQKNPPPESTQIK
jgi:hypothetical protein